MSETTSPQASNTALSAELALLNDIPPLSTAAHRLIEALSDENMSEKQLASIIDQNPALSAKIVGLANSAYFRRSTEISSLGDAIFLIGLRTVKSFAIVSALQEPFSKIRCPSFRAGHYWLHDVLTAHVARELARKVSIQNALHPEEAYLAGLLHNIGLLALVHLFPQKLNQILGSLEQTSDEIINKTQDMFGADYRTVGAALLKDWHLPPSFVQMTKSYADLTYKGDNWALCRVVGLARNWAAQVIQQGQPQDFNATHLNELGITHEQAAKISRNCMEQLDVYVELSEIICNEKAELYNPSAITQATIELKDRLVDTIDSLSSIRALTDLNIHTNSEEDLLREALKILMENQDMERCSIFINQDDFLVNASGLSWDEHFNADINKKAEKTSTHKFSMGEGIIGIVAKTAEMQHTRDTSADPAFKPLQKNAGYTPGSIICVPICFQDTTLGVLNISHSKANAFSDWHERFLTIFSNMLGQLIIYNRTIRDMDNEIALRTRELQIALKKAESLSIHDELTGIHNRRYFMEHFHKLLQQCMRYNYKMSVLMVDIDDFKLVNDTYGHLEGDSTLVKIANVLKECARDADIVARLGGEEFIIALQHTDADKANLVAERILQKVRLLACGEKENYHVTASIGISCLTSSANKDNKTFEQLIREADDALYQAKHSGKNCIVIHNKK